MIINEFDLNTPLENDPLSTADDEIRSIKGALVETFPHFDTAFTVKFSDLNKFSLSFNINNESKYWRLMGPKYSPVVDSKRLYIDNAGTVLYMSPLPPLGSIIMTILTLEQLDTIYGAGVFLKLDNSILTPEGTNKKANLTIATNGGILRTPNIMIAPPVIPPTTANPDPKRTLFLRQAEDETKLGFPEASNLGAPIGGTSTITSPVSHTHTAEHAHTIIKYSHNRNMYRDDPSDHQPWVGEATNPVVGSSIKIDTTKPNDGSNNDWKEWTEDYPHTHAIDTYTADAETRPKSITLHHYMRVN